jgi:hypothetical protein
MASSRAFGRVSPDMQVVVNPLAFPSGVLPRATPFPEVPPRIPAISDKRLYGMRVDKLRAALRNNQLSFPSQIPTFPKHTRPDLQRKLVQLYFTCGWSRPKIRARYGLSAQRFQQILSMWKNRAIELGYIQVIPPDQRGMLSSLRVPIRVVLSPAPGGSITRAFSSLGRFGGSKNGNGPARNWQESEKGCRPRRKCDGNQIANVLKQLQAGRSMAEMASEVGVTVSAIRVWKRQHEIRLLRRENRELKLLLVKLGAIEKTDWSH